MGSNLPNKPLRCVEIHKSFFGIPVLQGISIDFSPGSVTAIIGPNGAGKSTLFDVLTGFQKPDSGHCFLGYEDITGVNTYRLAQLGVVRSFQNLYLPQKLSAVDNIMLACPRQMGEKIFNAIFRKKATRQHEKLNQVYAFDLLCSVGLDSIANQKTENLSFGQQKLLSIMCCVATGASVLLFDEPMAGLHTDMVHQMGVLFKHLCDQGKQVIFVEHDFATVRTVAAKVVVINHGKVFIQGSPRTILDNPSIREAYFG